MANLQQIITTIITTLQLRSDDNSRIFVRSVIEPEAKVNRYKYSLLLKDATLVVSRIVQSCRLIKTEDTKEEILKPSERNVIRIKVLWRNLNLKTL